MLRPLVPTACFPAAALLALAGLCGCSPVYVYKSAAGHTRLLWRRQPIAAVLADPGAPAALKEKLRLVAEARKFAFARMGLKKSRDYGTYSAVPGPYLTYLVTASEKTRFKPYLWRFPLVGSFPYKGHFSREDARREKEELERLGYDAYLRGVPAYNTPLWFSDPVPSTVMGYSTGALAALILHELAHGTVGFKNQTGFNEAAATFIGDRGAEDFLSERFGPDSPALREFRRERERDLQYGRYLSEIHARLDELYRSTAAAEAKREAREAVFQRGLERLKSQGFEMREMNNAVILAHRLYHEDEGLFAAAHEHNGRDWPRTIAFLRSLDRKRPLEDLRRRVAGK